MAWNPWREARSIPDLTVAVLRLPAGQAWWLAEERAIVIDSSLSQAGRRSALAHELAHVEHGDLPQRCPVLRLRQERAADTRSAIRLIDIDALVEALLWSQDEHELAEHLWVDVTTVRARLATLTDAERDEIETALWKREESA